MQDELTGSLARVAFLLHKALWGDLQAMDNATDAIADAVRLLREANVDDEWMERYSED